MLLLLLLHWNEQEMTDGCGSLDTPISAIEASFRSLSSRDDIAIILINQHVRIERLSVLLWSWS